MVQQPNKFEPHQFPEERNRASVLFPVVAHQVESRRKLLIKIQTHNVFMDRNNVPSFRTARYRISTNLIGPSLFPLRVDEWHEAISFGLAAFAESGFCFGVLH